MAKDFRVDDRELKKFSEDLKIERASQIPAIQRTVLNEQAKATRLQAINNTIPSSFNLRSTWLTSGILADFAKGRDTKKMFSEVGAKKTWKRNPSKSFIGLRQQELGENIPDPEISSITSRGGIFSKNVKPSLRLHRLGNFVDISNPNQEIGIIRQLDREKFKGAIRIKRSKRFRKGIYKFSTKKFTTTRGKKNRHLQLIRDLSKSAARLTKRPWLSKATSKAVTASTVSRFYRRAFEKFTKKRLK
jgi:hypothetical protein